MGKTEGFKARVEKIATRYFEVSHVDEIGACVAGHSDRKPTQEEISSWEAEYLAEFPTCLIQTDVVGDSEFLYLIYITVEE